MKVIILQDTKNLGKKYEIKEVSDGYARNVLLPKKIVEVATKENLARLAQKIAALEADRAARVARLKTVAASLANLTLRFSLKAGEKGEVFGSITESDIKKELTKNGFADVEIKLPKHIKTFGEHLVPVELGEGVKATIRVAVSGSE
jgi:large subunit ribosomal protein L9